MKPRVFLGSSVEGLSLAYAIQTNLVHDAEITVWSQGVFELSKTTIESLFEILDSVDFGIFVFTPDDLVKIRQNSSAAVRDNVLFEFGLFLGKLGRQRVFFVIPSEEELHLPTDLLGITPAKYESKREDGNLIAATGAAAHQIRLMLKKYGSIQQIDEISNTPEITEGAPKEMDHWFADYYAKRYDEAIKKLEKEVEKETEERNIISFKITIALCQYRMDEKNIKAFDDILIDYKNRKEAYVEVGTMMLWEDHIEKAIEILEEGKQKFPDSFEIIEYLADCHLKSGNKQLAIDCFKSELTNLNPSTAIKFANIYIDDKDFATARNILHQVYQNFPNNKLVLAKYASVATELDLDKISLLFYDKLSKEEESDSSHVGYIGNACLKLNLHDTALRSYQRASEMENDSKEWLLSNIGNILKNRGFYTEAAKYLRKAIEVNSSSEYALERLATSLKLKEEENKEYNAFLKDARKMLQEYSANLIMNSTEKTAVNQNIALID